jgi:hypothetical protein
MNIKNISTILSPIFVSLLLLPVVQADLITPPGEIFVMTAIPLLIIGAVIGGIAWICFAIIRHIRNKNSPKTNNVPATKDISTANQNVRK